MATATEETVRQEQADYDAAQGAAAPDEDAGTQPNQDTELFDKSQYDKPGLRLQKIDGRSVDRIAIKFSGIVMLDRSEPADVALFRDLQLGKDVDLRVEVNVAHSGGTGATNRDGDLDVIVASKTLRVHSLRRPAGVDDIEVTTSEPGDA